jgi:hypothetical protein
VIDAREQILARVRAALADIPAFEPPAWNPEVDRDLAADYARARTADRDHLATVFAQRCGDYRATVVRCGETDEAILSAVSQAIARHQISSVLIPAGFEQGWLPDGVAAFADGPTVSDGLDGVAALAACALAIAETGTIVLDAELGQGRRGAEPCARHTPVRGAGRPDRIRGAGGDRCAAGHRTSSSPIDPHLGAVDDLGHRAGPSRRCARPAPARTGAERMKRRPRRASWSRRSRCANLFP